MTREEAKLRLKEVHGNDAFDRGVKSANRVAKIWINKIYDDFESRRCGNCVEYNENPKLLNFRCNPMCLNPSKDFGCTYFKRNPND